MISYWNVYYRNKNKELKNYIGYKIVKRVEYHKTYNKLCLVPIVSGL
jgi:hypothetical protein